ncbi:MAG: hypothetical protein UT13_C0001G0835 [Candidatus Pacebacteria bacterium GW2011_GWF2_38_9]|nr:MAG: hypothetical protein US01_C0001G0873 [candidate division TM6 bacterium GW2011_GWF2_28_16]KKQ07299.1 MAG: hypothetical protein US20_C0043G0010 [Candidatus Pacebacteria bacterium GW2011_GWF1_36_5]KKQ89187.1 MAG: hypothetical protein UT13_C0001G0835 [Candidatus Pacebacteria bacterium GW2011_GWF2_38_9]HAZ73759.1 hypothetical protein [Candidatus Paceibacterota bacterium]
MSEKEPNNSLINEVLSVVGLNTDSIAAFLADDEPKTPIAGHVGLLTSENLYSGSDGRIVGFWSQCIDQNITVDSGRVNEHDHGADGITEIVIVDKDSVYAGLPRASQTIGEYKLYFVKSGVRHGSYSIPSKGRWLSIKFKI